MKILNPKTFFILSLTIFFILILQGNLNANEKYKKPKWIQENVIASLTIKNSNILFKKIIEIINEISPNYNENLKKDIGDFYAIIENSTNFSILVFESPDKEPEFIFFITVSDAKLFDTTEIVEYEEKVIVNNTIIFNDEDESEHLEDFKKFVPILLENKQQNEIEFFYDLNHLFKKLIEESKGEYPNLEQFTKQLFAFSIQANLTKDFFSISAELIPTENSNLQKILTQPKIDNLSILEPIGIPNLFGCLLQLDTSKLYLLANEISKGFEKKDVDKNNYFLEVFKNLQDSAPSILIAENISYSDKLINSYIIKMNKSSENFLKYIESLSKNKNAIQSALKAIEEFFPIGFIELNYLKIDTNFSPIEKISNTNTEWEYYSIGKDQLNPTLPFKFAAVNESYIVISDTKEKNFSVCEKIKKNTTKPNITLESINYFKSGNIFYADLFINKILKYSIAEEGIDENKKSKFKKIFPDNMKPIMMAAKLEGTIETKIQINTQIIKSLLTYFFEDDLNELDNDEDNVPLNDKNSRP